MLQEFNVCETIISIVSSVKIIFSSQALNLNDSNNSNTGTLDQR